MVLSSYSEIVDLRTICAMVGHLKVGDAWAIIDRSGPYAQTVFTDDSLPVTGTNTDSGHWSFFLFSSLSNYQTFNNGVWVIMDLRWCGYKLCISFFLFSFITLFYSVCLLWVLRPSFTCLGLALKEHKLDALPQSLVWDWGEKFSYDYLSKKHWNPLSGVCKYKWLYVNTTLFGIVWSNTAFSFFLFLSDSL